MLSPGPGRLEPPRIEPFIRPRLQGGTHRARSTKPNSSSPDWGKRRLKPQSRAFPNAVISREPRSASNSLHTFHRFIRTAPSLTHQAACGAANQGLPGGASTRANPAVATRTQFERVRGRRRGGNDQSSARCLAAHLGTPVGDWDWDWDWDWEGPLFSRSAYGADGRQEFRVVLLRVGVCLDTRAHVCGEARSRLHVPTYTVVWNNDELGLSGGPGGSFRSRQAAQNIKKGAGATMYVPMY
jgi:hypothetical protein